jgi:hypothetical protein
LWLLWLSRAGGSAMTTTVSLRVAPDCDCADELAGTVGTGPATDEQRLAVQKIVAPNGLECFGNVLARVWGLKRGPDTEKDGKKVPGKWPLLAPQAAALIAASADGDFQVRYEELGTAEPEQST